MKNYHYFDQHAFDELVRARDLADNRAAELKSLETSFYAPQVYLYRTTGTFSTMFGQERGNKPVLVHEKRASIDLKLAELREKFWPTTKENRALAEAGAAKAKEAEILAKKKRTRIRTWGQSVGESVMGFFKHGRLPEKKKVKEPSPFAKLL
ncbi:hypothetical protein BU25DRAFT_61526 [Macroventuria anomochaeta]|uniref:Uncharacterized protein n=1 Tax=Macroventuria anomochaeta TaxID=301207 RepID=A0ACB6RZ84_9PLEO|nr:uncharacterized protein BU25DRAFT_61526 [Macroventuria anomochaeta]KAF2627336.1 hypothetical protein BU25DRAFT_61526 [Macroventuria anomochaeta]